MMASRVNRATAFSLLVISPITLLSTDSVGVFGSKTINLQNLMYNPNVQNVNIP